jgi:hypothetical protein
MRFSGHPPEKDVRELAPRARRSNDIKSRLCELKGLAFFISPETDYLSQTKERCESRCLGTNRVIIRPVTARYGTARNAHTAKIQASARRQRR